MKKISKLDLSGVEHLSDQEAKEYVADSSSSECISEAEDLTKSGSEGGSGGQITSPVEIPTDKPCTGAKEGDYCDFGGERGTCIYRKQTLPKEWWFDREIVQLTCVSKNNPDSGVELSEREYACVGKRPGESCEWFYSKPGAICVYPPFSPGGGVLFCTDVNPHTNTSM